MTLIEVRELVRRLGLTNALNLDGGGSTTMWAGGSDGEQPFGRGRAAEGERRTC